jgi:SAM-dependent methyltransferase
VSIPADYSFSRYLAAKKSVDDRSLNRQVWEALAAEVRSRPGAYARVLEVGCGIGTMLERLLDRGLLLTGAYTGIDLRGDLIKEAGDRLRGHAALKGGRVREGEGRFIYQTGDLQATIRLEAIGLGHFLEREAGRSSWDLLLAHAFLDLVDLPSTLAPLLALLRPGGLFYFTLNFDGATILQPPLDPELDWQIETLYHSTMKGSGPDTSLKGDCLTGRRLFGCLQAAGARVLAVGSSDWVVFPGPEGYPGDEAYFLHFIIQTLHQALKGHPGLEPERFNAWIKARHAQIEARELIYIAHQLDFFGYLT